MGSLKNSMGSRQIVLVSTAGFSVLSTGIFWREAKTKRLFSQCMFSQELYKNRLQGLFCWPQQFIKVWQMDKTSTVSLLWCSIRDKGLPFQYTVTNHEVNFHDPDQVTQTKTLHGAKKFLSCRPEFSDEFSAPP